MDGAQASLKTTPDIVRHVQTGPEGRSAGGQGWSCRFVVYGMAGRHSVVARAIDEHNYRISLI